MPNQHGSHRFGQRHFGRQIERISQHDFFEALCRLRQQHVAHHDDPKKSLLFVGNEGVGNDSFARQATNLLGCFCDRCRRTKNCQRRLHELPNCTLRIGLIAHPLSRGFGRSSGQDRFSSG